MLSNIKSIASRTALVAMGVGLAGAANAQVYSTDRDARRDNEPFMGIHPYVGASYGLYKSGAGDYDEDRDLWEAYGGLALHRYFGVEANYTNIGDQSSDAANLSIDGWGLSAVAQWPIHDMFSVYGKLGQFFWNADLDVADLNADYDGDDPFFTVGVGFGVMAPLTVTLEYTRYAADIDLGEMEGLDEPFENSDAGDLDTAKIGVRLAF